MITPSKTERLIQKNDFFLTRGHDFVEIDGVKWATCNVGAKKPTDPGLYFQWGDTQGYTTEQCGKYKHLFRSEEYKYHHIDKPILEASNDAAHFNWGGAWRMPTIAEFEALCKVVNTYWTTDYQGSGVAGLVCVDRIDVSKKLFFPAAGFFNRGEQFSLGISCPCWTSSGFTNEAARYFLASKYTVYTNSVAIRSCGMTIRPILKITKLSITPT